MTKKFTTKLPTQKERKKAIFLEQKEKVSKLAENPPFPLEKWSALAITKTGGKLLLETGCKTLDLLKTHVRQAYYPGSSQKGIEFFVLYDPNNQPWLWCHPASSGWRVRWMPF